MLNMKSEPLPFTSQLLKEVIEELGGRVEFESTYKFAGELFLGKKRRLFTSLVFELNNYGSATFSIDKSYTAYLLKKYELPTPKTQAIFREDYKPFSEVSGVEQAKIFAQKIGYPVAVKPNGLSEGREFSVARNEKELVIALNNVHRVDVIALVQQFVPGNDYRVLMLDGKLLCAYQRLPLSVIGNGKDSIQKLLNKHLANLQLQGRKIAEETNEQVKRYMKQKGINPKEVLGELDEVFLLPNANLSMGGDAIDLTKHIHKDYVKLAIKAMKVLNLRYAGVDILAKDLTSPLQKKDVILELNAKPSVRHFATYIERKRLKQIYTKIVLAMFDEQ